jgi:hypothetical protein
MSSSNARPPSTRASETLAPLALALRLPVNGNFQQGQETKVCLPPESARQETIGKEGRTKVGFPRPEWRG